MWDTAVRGVNVPDVQRVSDRPEAPAGAGQQAEGGAAAPRPQPPQAPQTDGWTPGRKQDDAPSLWEMLRDAQARAEQMREKFSELKPPVRYGDIPVQAYARLARARTRGDVGAAEGYARRQIVRLKAALRQDPDNSEAIRSAIRQLQKTVCRAGRKKYQLDRERLLQLKRRKAEELRRCREELRLRQELRRRMASRAMQEGGYVREAIIDGQMQQAMAAEAAKWQISAPQAACPAQAAAAYSAAAQPPAPTAEGGVETKA